MLEREARQHGCVGALLMGDMNWGDQDGDPLHTLGGGWVDAWQAAGSPKAAKATCGWSFRLDRCFVLSLGHDAGGRALGASGGGPPDDGGGGSGGDGLAVRVAGVTLVGGEPIAGEFYEHLNKRSGQSKCASNSMRTGHSDLSICIYRERAEGREGTRARGCAQPTPPNPLRACVHRRTPLPPSDHKGLLVQLEAGSAGGSQASSS